jgi:hypothetical protein
MEIGTSAVAVGTRCLAALNRGGAHADWRGTTLSEVTL